MRFNFVLTNQSSAALQVLDDVLRPVFAGLRASGHQVIAGARRFQKSPTLNVVVGDVADQAFVQAIGAARAAWADEFRLCVFSPGGLAGMNPAVEPSDVRWTVAPGAGPAAVVTYGFDDKLLGPRLILDPALRDLDVVVYGPEGDRLTRLIAQLAADGLGHFVVRPGALPDYLVTDLLSRAKVVAVIGDDAFPPAALAPRILKALCNGVVVVAAGPPSAAGPTAHDPLWDLVVRAPADEIAAACRRLIDEARYVDRGQAALEHLRARWTMRDGVRDALALVTGASGGG